MKIVIDARIINSSTGRYIERLLTYLQKLDTPDEYIVLVPERDKDYWKPSKPNFKIVIANQRQFSLAEQFSLARLLYSLKADVVHFTVPHRPVLYIRPCITAILDMTLLKTYNSDKNWLVYHLKQLVGRVVFFIIAHTSSRIITISKFTKKEYVAFAKINPNKVSVTHLASGIVDIKPRPVKLPFDQYLLYVGQQSDYKNIRGLVSAHQQLRAARPGLGLVLVGGKNETTKRNITWVRSHGFKGILFTGFLPDDQVAWLYKNCMVYVFPSFMEGFGLPGLEAMSSGAPVASSNATSLPEVYGKAAVYFNPASVTDMASQIEKVLASPRLRKALIAAGRLQAKKYSWATMAQQTYDVYLQTVKK